MTLHSENARELTFETFLLSKEQTRVEMGREREREREREKEKEREREREKWLDGRCTTLVLHPPGVRVVNLIMN